MAHIVCVTKGLSGLLYSSFELARRLEAAGYEVTYMTRADASGAVKAQGLTYHELPKPLSASSPYSPSQNGGGLKRLQRWVQRFGSIRARRQHYADALGGREFADALDQLRPDVLLIDIEMHGYIITAVPTGIPTALLSPFFSLWKRPGVPPLHTAIIPGQGQHGHRLGIEWAWLWFRVSKGLNRWRKVLRSAGAEAVSIHRHLARQMDFPHRTEFALYQWPIPFTYRTLPVLCLNAWELEFPHDPRSGLHYVGPMVHQQRQDVHTGAGVQDRLQALMAERRTAATERPLVLVSCSTFAKTSPVFVQRIVRAAAQRPEWEVILSLGGKGAVEDLGALPDNVHAFSWVPVLDVLPHTAVVVTNAGINTINECILFGVPSVVYSLRTNDQNGTAARVAYHGVGVVGSLDDSAVTLVAQIEQALTDTSIQRRINQLQARFHAYENEQPAVRLVEQMLSAQQPSAPEPQPPSS